jgi:hypothetical protein
MLLAAAIRPSVRRWRRQTNGPLSCTHQRLLPAHLTPQLLALAT